MHHYCSGVLSQVQSCNDNDLPSIEEMIAVRELSIGAYPLLPLIEFAYELELPDEAFECAAIKKLESICLRLVFL